MKCDNTCNLTLVSRSKPDLIDKSLFHSFSVNDKEAAWQYAFSAELERKNNMKLDYGSVEYEVISSISPEDIQNLSDEVISIRIKCDFDFNLKLSSLVRRCLSLSANQMKRLFEQNAISTSASQPLQKQKVRNGDVILIDREQFTKSFKEIAR